jgi:membrane dipeptidase
MIDLSHPSKAATLEMMALSRAPVIASHSSARAVNDVPRNMDDEQLMALKANGGVIQTVALRSYLDSEKDEALAGGKRPPSCTPDRRGDGGRGAHGPAPDVHDAAGRPQGLPRTGTRPVSMAALRASTTFSTRRRRRRLRGPHRLPGGKVGIDHVGIASDFDGGGGVTRLERRLRDLQRDPRTRAARLHRGAEIDKIWSGNLLRVMGQVQAVAAMIQAEDAAEREAAVRAVRPGSSG